MHAASVKTGLVLIAVLAVLDLLSPLISDGQAPVAADVFSVVLGVLTLVGLALYLAPGTRERAGRGGMWTAVVARSLSALPKTILTAFARPPGATAFQTSP